MENPKRKTNSSTNTDLRTHPSIFTRRKKENQRGRKKKKRKIGSIKRGERRKPPQQRGKKEGSSVDCHSGRGNIPFSHTQK